MASRRNSTIQWTLKCGALLAAAIVLGVPVLAQDPILDAYSPEVVVVNSQASPAFTDAYSRESVVVNSDSVLTPAEASSRDATVVISESPGYSSAYSRDAVLIANEVPPILAQADSREVVLVTSETVVLTQANSREAVAVVSESPIVDTFSREIAVYDGYYVWEGFNALRIAGGLDTATPVNVNRFSLALQLTNATRINLPVAIRILRIATRLQP